MKKALLTLGILALGFGSLIAGPVSQQKAQNIGAKFLSTTELGQQKTDIQLNLVSAALTRDAVDYYIFNVKGGNGFVVVSGDDCVKPILAYATTGSYSTSDVAPGFQFTLNGYRDDIRYVREHNIAASADIVSEWKSIEQTGYIRAERNTRTVDVLCPTLWNQGKYYNDQCPEDPEGPNGRVYAGCVATAMGQVLYYWNHPIQGTGSHSYTPGGWGYPSYPTQTANFGETEYHWELMPLQLDSTSTQEEIFYIAQVLHHLGISVDMMYSANGSGAYSFDVPDALHRYFGFVTANLIQKDGYWGGGYSNQEWAAALKAELDELRPIYYSGSDDAGNGGHAFVCDAYDENDYFHYNWGWDGRDNAFCAIGALNTTKYAFNQGNAALIGLYPQTESYYARPEQVDKMNLAENDTFDGVIIGWGNPSNDISGNPLTGELTIEVRRNFEVVATFENAEPGAAMTYTDMVPESRIYEYSIFASNEAGASIPVYQKILVGEKCDMLFELNDEAGNGWKGAAISVTNMNGNRIAVITMEDGATELKSVPLLRGDLNFFWNHGWYHSSEEYDTDFECSFTISDGDGNVLFTSPETLEDGLLMTYNNNCEGGQLICHRVQNLEGEYTWNNAEEFGVTLTWSNPVSTNHLDHFNVYRGCEPEKEGIELIAEVPFDVIASYEYFDDLTGIFDVNYFYQVTAVYIDGDDQCESDPEEVNVIITAVDESKAAKIYPNPTSGMLNIEGQGRMHISISNMMGQVVGESDAEGNAVLDMSRYQSGIYFVRIETANGCSVTKVTKQ